MKRFIPYILLTLILIATYTLIIRRFDLDTVEKLEAAFNERQSIAVNLSARSLEDWYRSLLDRLELVGQRPVFHTFNPLAASQTQQEIGLLLRQNLDTVFLAAAYVRQSVSPVVIQFDAARDLEHDTALLTHWVNLYTSSVMASGEPFVTPIEAAPDASIA